MALGTDIAVIIVNYGTAELAIAGVKSVLERKHGGRHVEIHLVDNASPSGDAERFAQTHATCEWGERVTIWPETDNHGFGRGNNVVIKALAARAIPPRYVFLLNPDATLDNEALDLLASHMDAHPEVAACGAGISFPSGKPVTAAFRFPSARGIFAHAVNFGPLTSRFKRHLTALPPDHPQSPVDWVSGAAVMFRFDVLQALDGFDPVFFLYYEELELMHRIKMAGHEIHYLPDARIFHIEGAATDVKSGGSKRKAKPGYWYASWLHYFRKTHGRGGALRMAIAWLAGAALNAPIAALRGQSPSYPLHFFRDFRQLIIKPLLRNEKINHD
ncbi:MAG: glycosyltransferase family 2 protein [Paracoccus sp. (in: a-proteobacteria)]